MAEGYYERGEVYWCRIDHNIGGEMGVTRPAVVVSKNEYNNKFDSVVIAWLTSRPKAGETYVNTIATGRESWIITQQLYTVDKSRFGKLMGVLSYHEMRDLDTALENTLDLGYADDELMAAKDGEIRQRDGVIHKLEQQIMELEKQLSAKDDLWEKQRINYAIEAERVNKMYFAALDKLVEIQFERDYNERVTQRVAVVQPDRERLKAELGLPTHPVVVEESPVEDEKAIKGVSEPPVETKPVVVTQPAPPKSEYGDDMVDLNTCTLTRLKKMGFTMSLARDIVARRPYTSVEGLLKVPGLKKTMYNIAKPKLYCSGVEVKEATPKKETQFEVDPGYEEEPQPTPEEQPEEQPEVVTVPVRVNVNTATARQIHEISGITLSTCYRITQYRKEHGPYSCLEELLNAKQVYPGTLERHRDKLEV